MLSCHTHSNVGFCNPAIVEQSRSLLVVIPTQMWASATHGKDCVSVDVFVVIPTQMWASATSTLNKNINLIRVVIPTQMWASATSTFN